MRLSTNSEQLSQIIPDLCEKHGPKHSLIHLNLKTVYSELTKVGDVTTHLLVGE